MKTLSGVLRLTATKRSQVVEDLSRLREKSLQVLQSPPLDLIKWIEQDLMKLKFRDVVNMMSIIRYSYLESELSMRFLQDAGFAAVVLNTMKVLKKGIPGSKPKQLECMFSAITDMFEYKFFGAKEREKFVEFTLDVIQYYYDDCGYLLTEAINLFLTMLTVDTQNSVQYVKSSKLNSHRLCKIVYDMPLTKSFHFQALLLEVVYRMLRILRKDNRQDDMNLSKDLLESLPMVLSRGLQLVTPKEFRLETRVLLNQFNQAVGTVHSFPMKQLYFTSERSKKIRIDSVEWLDIGGTFCEIECKTKVNGEVADGVIKFQFQDLTGFDAYKASESVSLNLKSKATLADVLPNLNDKEWLKMTNLQIGISFDAKVFEEVCKVLHQEVNEINTTPMIVEAIATKANLHKNIEITTALQIRKRKVTKEHCMGNVKTERNVVKESKSIYEKRQPRTNSLDSTAKTKTEMNDRKENTGGKRKDLNISKTKLGKLSTALEKNYKRNFTKSNTSEKSSKRSNETARKTADKSAYIAPSTRSKTNNFNMKKPSINDPELKAKEIPLKRKQAVEDYFPSPELPTKENCDDSSCQNVKRSKMSEPNKDNTTHQTYFSVEKKCNTSHIGSIVSKKEPINDNYEFCRFLPSKQLATDVPNQTITMDYSAITTSPISPAVNVIPDKQLVSSPLNRNVGCNAIATSPISPEFSNIFVHEDTCDKLAIDSIQKNLFGSKNQRGDAMSKSRYSDIKLLYSKNIDEGLDTEYFLQSKQQENSSPFSDSYDISELYNAYDQSNRTIKEQNHVTEMYPNYSSPKISNKPPAVLNSVTPASQESVSCLSTVVEDSPVSSTPKVREYRFVHKDEQSYEVDSNNYAQKITPSQAKVIIPDVNSSLSLLSKEAQHHRSQLVSSLSSICDRVLHEQNKYRSHQIDHVCQQLVAKFNKAIYQQLKVKLQDASFESINKGLSQTHKRCAEYTTITTNVQRDAIDGIKLAQERQDSNMERIQVLLQETLPAMNSSWLSERQSILKSIKQTHAKRKTQMQNKLREIKSKFNSDDMLTMQAMLRRI